MRRKITHGRRAAEKLALKWFADAGVPRHVFGFSENEGFYIVIHCMARGRIEEFSVPGWGARVLRNEVDLAIKFYKAT